MFPCFDLQVNGYAGLDFNSQPPTLEAMEHGCQKLLDAGVTRILATVITAPVEAMRQRIQAIADALATSTLVQQVVAGIHVEGPFISPEPGYVGAHPRQHVLPADLRVCQQLCAAGQGHVRLVTLAPETDPTGQVVRFLTAQQIVVAAGHTNASRDELQRAIDQGLRMFTHLGNGCPLLLPRHDNIIHRVLSLADQLHVSLIADRRHLPEYVLRLFLEQLPEQNIVIVSDSIAAAGLGAGSYHLGEQTIRVDDQGIAWTSDGQYQAGSTAVLSHMVAWLRAEGGYTPAQVEQWTWLNPLKLLTAE
jgi:N-acetylglucosamine-6-phosphate deacetylase